MSSSDGPLRRFGAIDWGLNYNTDSDKIIHCREIAAVVTQTNTDAAIALIGVSGSEINLG